jgi:hypothetical protein
MSEKMFTFHYSLFKVESMSYEEFADDPMEMIGSVHGLVSSAIVLGPKQ